MAHIYITFDFGTDEGQAQQARHKLDGWKQAFRLDKKLQYRFERKEAGSSDDTKEPESATAKPQAGKPEKPARGGKAAKSDGAKGQTENQKKDGTPPAPAGPVKLHLRLAFSGHEKMTEERWVKRIPSEEPFKEASPKTVKAGDAEFPQVESRFDALE